MSTRKKRPNSSATAARRASKQPSVLYHFTSVQHLARILAVGHIDVTESNLHPTLDHVGDDVVWLTTRSTGAGCGLDYGLPEPLVGVKRQVRFTVTPVTEDTHWWPKWSRSNGIARAWADALERRAGRSGAGDGWWVCTTRIPLSLVTTVEVDGREIDFGSLAAA